MKPISVAPSGRDKCYSGRTGPTGRMTMTCDDPAGRRFESTVYFDAFSAINHDF